MDGQLWVWKIAGIVIIFVVNVFGCIAPVIFYRWFARPGNMGMALCFSSGVLLATSFLSLIPESLRGQSPLYILLACSTGFIATLFIQWNIEAFKRAKESINADYYDIDIIDIASEDEWRENQGSPTGDEEAPHNSFNPFVFFGLVLLEAIFSSMAIGSRDSVMSTIILLMSVAISDWLEASILTLGLIAHKSMNKSKKKILLLGMIFTAANTLVTIASIVTFGFISGAIDSFFSDLMTSFVAGSFIYMSCVDILAREIIKFKQVGTFKEIQKQIGLFILGFLLISVIVLFEFI